jgi:hypothetical protein
MQGNRGALLSDLFPAQPPRVGQPLHPFASAICGPNERKMPDPILWALSRTSKLISVILFADHTAVRLIIGSTPFTLSSTLFFWIWRPPHFMMER